MGFKEERDQYAETAAGLAKLLEEVEDAVNTCETGLIRETVLRIVRRRFGIIHQGIGSLFGE